MDLARLALGKPQQQQQLLDGARMHVYLALQLRLSQSRESQNCGIEKAKETHFRRETRIAFVASHRKKQTSFL